MDKVEMEKVFKDLFNRPAPMSDEVKAIYERMREDKDEAERQFIAKSLSVKTSKHTKYPSNYTPPKRRHRKKK